MDKWSSGEEDVVGASVVLCIMHSQMWKYIHLAICQSVHAACGVLDVRCGSCCGVVEY